MGASAGVGEEVEVSVPSLLLHFGWSLNHLSRTRGIGHAVDSAPSPAFA